MKMEKSKSTPQKEHVGTPIKTTQSKTRKKSDSSALGHKSANSVQNLVPSSVWGKVPSLMKLIDHQKVANTLSRPKSAKLGSLGDDPEYEISSEKLDEADEEIQNIFEDVNKLPSQETLLKQESNDIMGTDIFNRQFSSDIDLQSLAIKAAEEFQSLATENEFLQKENASLKVKLEESFTINEQLNLKLHDQNDDEQLNNDLKLDIQKYQSRITALEMEKQYFQQTINDLQSRIKDEYQKNVDTTEDNNLIHNDNNNSGNENEYLLSLKDQLTKYSELREQFEIASDELKELRLNTTTLKKTILQKDKEIKELKKDLNTQQINYIKLKELQGQRVESLEEKLTSNSTAITTRVRALTKEAQDAQNKNEELKRELQETKLQIAELEAQKQDMLEVFDELQKKKIEDDDGMFSQLAHLRNATQRNVMSTVGHLRSDSQASYSNGSNWYNYGQNFGFGDDDDEKAVSNSGGNHLLKVKSVRLRLVDENSYMSQHEEHFMKPNTPTHAESVIIKMPNNEIEDLKEDLQKQKLATEQEKKRWELEMEKRKRLELAKLSAETEFFLLTCLSVKKNLIEEYSSVNPQIEEALMEENPNTLFQIAQELSIPMHHFGIWCESRIREKYDLPKMKRFKTRFKYKFKAAEESARHKWQKLGLGEKIRKFSHAMGEKIDNLKAKSALSPIPDENKETNFQFDGDSDVTPSPQMEPAESKLEKKVQPIETDDKDGKTDSKESPQDSSQNPPNSKCCIIL